MRLGSREEQAMLVTGPGIWRVNHLLPKSARVAPNWPASGFPTRRRASLSMTLKALYS